MSKRNPRATAKMITAVATKLGFIVVHTPGGHRAAVHPSGSKIYFATTSVSPRGAKNAIAMLRRTARQLGATAD